MKTILLLLALLLTVSCGDKEVVRVIHNNDRVTLLEARMTLNEANDSLLEARVASLENRMSQVETSIYNLRSTLSNYMIVVDAGNR